MRNSTRRPPGWVKFLRRDRALDLVPLALAEMDVGRLQIFFKMRNRAGARNRQDHRRAMQQPRNRQLCNRCIVALRDLVELATGLRESARGHWEPRNEAELVLLAV